MARHERNLEIAIRARDEYSKKLQSATSAVNKFKSAADKAADRRNLKGTAQKWVDDTAKSYQQAQKDAQRYAKTLKQVQQAENLTAAEMREVEDSFERARERVRHFKNELGEARGALHSFKGPATGERGFSGLQKRADAMRRSADAAREAAAAEREQNSVAAITATRLKRLNAASGSSEAAQEKLANAFRNTNREMRNQAAAAASVSRGRGAAGGGSLAEEMAGSYATRHGRGPLGLRPYELTNLSYQVNDVVSGLAMGQAPMQVFAQQAGQLIQIFPKLTTALFKLAPAVAIIAPFALGLSRLNREAENLSHFETKLQLLGDGAKYSSRELAEATERLERAGAAFQGAQETISSLAEAGIAPGQIDALAAAALQLSQLRGVDLEDATNTVVDAFKEGVEGVRELDNEIGFLTASQYEQILAMKEAGDETGAMAIAADALETKLSSVSSETEGWAAAMSSLGAAWDGAMESLADSAAIRLAAEGLGSLGEMVNFAAGALEDAFDKPDVKAPQVKIDTSIDDDQLKSEIARTQELIDRYQKTKGQVGVFGSTLAGALGLPVDRLEVAGAILERRLELLEEEKRVRAESTQEQQNERKLALDIQQIVTKHLNDLREQLENEKLTKREKKIQEALDEAREAALERAVELGREFKGLTEEQTKAIREQAGALFDRNAALNPKLYEAQFSAARFNGQGGQEELVKAVAMAGEKMGVSAEALMTAISYETAGTFDPWKKGPTTKNGEHRGLIQWGEPQRQQYGVTQDMSVTDQVAAITRYLADRGVKKGDGLLQIYAAINAGNARNVNASDEAAGGMPGTVTDKVNSHEMQQHAAKAQGLMAAYSGVAEEAAETTREQEKQAEESERFHDSLSSRLDLQQLENSLTDANLVDREVALALRKAELDAQKAGTELTAEERAQIEATTREKYRGKAMEDQRNEALKEAKRLQQEVARLEERRNAIIERKKYAQEQGDQAGFQAAESELQGVNTQLDAAIQKAIAFWQALGGEGSAAAIQKLQITQEQLGRVETKSVTTGKAMNEFIAGEATDAFDNWAQRIANGENVLDSFGAAFMQMAADILIQLGRMIVQQAIFNMISGMFGGGMGGGGGLGGMISGGINAMFNHSGGIAGQDGVRRTVPISAFEGAMRYHEGGLPGLKSNEVPTVLEEGEEVLTEDNPRHRKNAGRGGGQNRPLKIINTFDASDVLEQALGSDSGDELILNKISSLKTQINAVLSE